MPEVASPRFERDAAGFHDPDRLIALCSAALRQAETYGAEVRAVVERRCAEVGAGGLDSLQLLTHGYAWIATYVAALRSLLDWARRLRDLEALGSREREILLCGFAEYLAQLGGGAPMSQGEIVRPRDFGIDPGSVCSGDPCVALINAGASARTALAASLADGMFGEPARGDDALDLVAQQFHRFSSERVEPYAHRWHLEDAYIPLGVIDEMAALGVFGLTVPETWGGSGFGKLAMCVASEELSRAFIGVGSLGTRAEIASELILAAGAEAQKQRYLPAIASGAMLPTAVFTEPNIGSDLANLTTRAERVETSDGRRVWRVTGSKTWITHAARADLMTLLVRTEPTAGHRGLSMLLAEKPRGTDGDPFPARGMSGGEIPVLGYRGMKEFEISFDGFEVPEENLLGGVPGCGFKQLMATFESARIQTAARAVGVAQNALELGLRYSTERVQFGQPILGFPRISGKLAWMVVEIMIARQLTYAAARRKDEGKRCDIEAGMAKLLAARVAWAAADNAVQIHGGNGFALEYPVSRVLCDARILSIFEGAAEIQAQVIARGLLERGTAE